MSTRRSSSPTASPSCRAGRPSWSAASIPSCRALATASPPASCRGFCSCGTRSWPTCCVVPMRERLIGATVIAVLLAALEIATRGGAVNAVLVPPPSAIAQRTYAVIANGTVLQPLMQTLYLLFVAYFIACAVAVALGLLMGRFQAIHNLFEPVVESLRPLPKAALLPPLMMLLGLGDAMKLAVVGLAVIFPVL